MKREVVERKRNSSAPKQTKGFEPKSQAKKTKAIVEKPAKSAKPRQKTNTPKSVKPVSDKIVKQPKETKPKSAKAKAAVSKTKKQKPETIVSVKASKPKANQKTPKEKIVNQKPQKQIKAAAKDKKPRSNKVLKSVSSQKTKPLTQKSKSKVSENKSKVSVKTIDLPKEPQKKPARKKPVKPISIAVFRGIKDRYDFKVFPINENFEAVKGVFIISKRTTDRQKRGHHKLVCIGQTDSIFEELKKHRKSRCLFKNEANVISILPEENEARRLQIAIDLKAAHAISCNLP